jgi:hypothetical protein
MAYMQDIMGNPNFGYGGEDEETRRKRLEEEARKRGETEVGKQEVITYADGSQTRKTTREVPAPTRSVAGPVRPSKLFQSMLQAESGDRQFTPQGQVVTSPAGAMGAAQVMPATAMQPGFGLPNIFDLAQQRGIPFTARDEAGARELLGNEQLNREFGQNYATAMQNRFGPQGGVAAYNAGPGRVERNMAANQGQLNVAGLPQETQGYLGKVMRGVGQMVNAVVPSAQASTMPQPSAGQGRGSFGMPQAQPGPGVAVATGQGVQGTTTVPEQPQVPSQFDLAQGQGMPGLRMPGVTPDMMPQPGQQPTLAAQEEYMTLGKKENLQDNIDDYMRFRADTTKPEYLRRRAADTAYELMNRQVNLAKAEERLPSLKPTEAARILSTEPKNEEGSWLKFLLMGFISPQLAAAEAIKLGIAPTRWEDALIRVGDQDVGVQVKRRADGKILSGSFQDGTPLSADQLSEAQSGIQRKGIHVTKTENLIDPQSGQVVTKSVLSNNRQTFMVGGRPYSGDLAALVPEAKFTEAENRRVGDALNDLRKSVAKPTQDDVYRALVAARVPNRRIELEMGLPPGTLGTGAGRQALGEGAAPKPAAGPSMADQVAEGKPRAPSATVPAAAPAAPSAVPEAAATPSPTRTVSALTPRAQLPGETNEAYKIHLKTLEAQAKQEAEELGQDIGKLKTNFGTKENIETTAISNINKLIGHPGFENVGSKLVEPEYLFGARKTPLAGTKAFGFEKDMERLLGTTFLQQYNNLRGGGAITEAEGGKATQAFPALNSDMSKEDFIREAIRAQNQFKGISNRDRAKLGMAPKYPVVFTDEQINNMTIKEKDKKYYYKIDNNWYEAGK